MARNKYIYCLAESAMVVRAGMTGGTITGAMEALKHQWLPMQVKPNQGYAISQFTISRKWGVMEC